MKNEKCVNCKFLFWNLDADSCFFKCNKSGERIDNIEGKCKDFERKVKSDDDDSKRTF